MTLHDLLVDKNDLPLDAEIERQNDTDLVVKDLTLHRDTESMNVSILFDAVSREHSGLNVCEGDVFTLPYYTDIKQVAAEVIRRVRIIWQEVQQSHQCLKEQLETDAHVAALSYSW